MSCVRIDAIASLQTQIEFSLFKSFNSRNIPIVRPALAFTSKLCNCPQRSHFNDTSHSVNEHCKCSGCCMCISTCALTNVCICRSSGIFHSCQRSHSKGNPNNPTRSINAILMLQRSHLIRKNFTQIYAHSQSRQAIHCFIFITGVVPDICCKHTPARLPNYRRPYNKQ